MKSKKNRTMKTFEEIYRDAAVRNGCNAGKTFARVMFEEGMSQNLERCMDRAAGSHTDLMAFAGWYNRRQEIHHLVRYGRTCGRDCRKTAVIRPVR